MVFLYMSNEHVDTEIKNTIPFIIQKKKNEILRCKPSKPGLRSVYRKPHDTDEQNQTRST